METFEKLPKEKQDAILNAGLACFGKNGYKKTAVADIAGMAGVSKASLFHYFGTKKDLWLYLYNFGIQMMRSAVFTDVATAGDDLFDRLWLVQKLKMESGLLYPSMFAFFSCSVAEDAPEIQQERGEHYEQYVKAGFAVLLDGVDFGRFKPDVDITKVINLITWVSEGFAASVLPNTQKSHEEVRKEGEQYIAMLKPAFYKEEYL